MLGESSSDDLQPKLFEFVLLCFVLTEPIQPRLASD